MKEETPNVPSSDVVAAAASAAAEPAPAPAPDPVPELEEIPEGDTFDRAYVEKLRNEAAKHRTRARSFEDAFSGYSESERDRFLDLAGKLNSDPESALDEFRDVTIRLAEKVGKEPFVMSEEVVPEVAADPAPAVDIDALIEAKFAERQAAADKQSDVERTFAEAEALDPGYKDPAAKAHLFAVAQHNSTDLAGAHEILQNQLQSAIDAAIESHMEGLRSGTVHPPRLPSGEAAVADSGPPKTLEEARRRATERMNAAFGG